MSEVAEVQSIGAKALTSRLAERFGIDENKMMAALRATAFKTKEAISNEQMMALCVVAEQYDLNPWTKEIYAFPTKQGGIVPVVGVDGWSRIINSNEAFDGMEYEYSEQIIESPEHKPCPSWVKCTIYRKDRGHPISVTEYLDECYQPPRTSQYGPVVGPWQTHTKRFLRHKATIQCARIAFGFVGIYDPDEAERVIEAEVISKKSTSARAAALEGESWDTAKEADYADQLKEAMPDKESIDYVSVNQLADELQTQGPLYIAVLNNLESWQRTAIKNRKEHVAA
jgi:phage recombination protein Bet